MGTGRVFLSHYRRHPAQLLALLLIVCCAATLWSGVQTLTDRAQRTIRASAAALEPRMAVLRVDGRRLDVKDFARLRRAGLCVTPQLTVRLTARDGRTLELLGIDPLSADCLRQRAAIAQAGRRLTAALAAPPLLGTAATLARWRRLPLAATVVAPLVEVPRLPAGVVLTDIAVAERVRQAGPARLTLLMPKPAPGAALSLPAGYRAIVDSYGVASDTLAESFLLSLDALGWLALLVAGLLVRSVYRLALEQRRRTLLLLRRFGVPRWQLWLWPLLELLALALAGGTVGVMLGGLLAAMLGEGFRATLAGLFDIDGLGTTAPPLTVWLRAVLLLSLLFGWCCADLIVAQLRPSAPVPVRSEGEGRYIRFGLSLILSGALAVLLASQLWLVFAATGLGLVGGGLLLPPLLTRLLAWIERRARRPLLEWSCSEMRALGRLLMLPLLALAFAIAAAIGIQAMVTDFETTFSRWLDQRLQGDLYLDPGRDVDEKRWAQALHHLPGVDAVLPMVRGQALVAGHPADLLAVDPASPLRAGWRFLAALPDPWQRLQEQGVMVNEQLARRRGLGLGDRLHITMGSSSGERRVVAIYADYGRPAGEVLLPLAALPEALPRRYTTFALGLAAGTAADRADWRRRMPALAGSRIRDQGAIRAAARAVFGRTFRLTRALSVLTLALAGVALALMGATILRLRRPHYTLLYVCGVGRAALRCRLVVHAGLIAALLSILATPLGLFLTWVLVARVNPIAFGWALPFSLYPADWLQVWLASAAVGMLAGLAMGDPVRLETLKNE